MTFVELNNSRIRCQRVADSFWKSGFTKKESQTMLREMGFALKDVKRAMNNWLGTTFSDARK